MLTESFIASVQTGPKSAASSSLPKDAAIFLHDYQPLPSMKGTLKKSSTSPNCLAVTSTHIFAAQSDKALVQVYSRDKGNQETIVPFPSRITSLVRIGPVDGAAILALGTEAGGLLLWELYTGRLVSTELSHLQAVTCIAVDSTTSFILTGSTDSSIHIWSTTALLSFTDPGVAGLTQGSRTAPLRHLSGHRGAITSIRTAHSRTNADFAISASEDKTCLVWNYRTGDLLHTFLVPETPLCLAIDPADRAFFVGLEDGSVQLINFQSAGSSVHILWDRNLTDIPTQAVDSDRWRNPTPLDKILSIALSYDGTSVLSGHANGKVFAWEVGQRKPPSEVSDLGQPTTNILMVPPHGFPERRKDHTGVELVKVIKPRPDAFPHTGGSGLSVPQNYTFTASFAEPSAVPRFGDGDGKDTLMAGFETAISDGSFPPDLLRAATAEIAGAMPSSSSNESVTIESAHHESAQQEIERLRKQLQNAETVGQKLGERLNYAERRLEASKRAHMMKRRAQSEERARKGTEIEKMRNGLGEEEWSDDTDEAMEFV